MKSLNEIKVSIIIPVYNSENTIAPLIKDVKKEIVPKLGQVEFVLVNNGSQDNTVL